MRNFKRYNDRLNIVGSKIKFHRESKEMSLVELSNALMLLGIDIPKNSLQRLESGKRTLKDYELATICKVLKLSADEILKDFMKELDQ